MPLKSIFHAFKYCEINSHSVITLSSHKSNGNGSDGDDGKFPVVEHPRHLIFFAGATLNWKRIFSRVPRKQFHSFVKKFGNAFVYLHLNLRFRASPGGRSTRQHNDDRSRNPQYKDWLETWTTWTMEREKSPPFIHPSIHRLLHRLSCCCRCLLPVSFLNDLSHFSIVAFSRCKSRGSKKRNGNRNWTLCDSIRSAIFDALNPDCECKKKQVDNSLNFKQLWQIWEATFAEVVPIKTKQKYFGWCLK